MTNIPLVTVGIPNYNYSGYVIEALNSVVAQTYQNIEIIIIDDLSTDESVEVINQWIMAYQGKMKIIFIKNTVNSGLAKVCNQILYDAKGKYFQTLDADDILLCDKIEKQVELLEAADNAALVYSNVEVIDETGKIIDDNYFRRIKYDQDNMPGGDIFENLFDFNFIPLPSVLVNTEYAKKVGGFDDSLHIQDYYMWLKLAEKFKAIHLPAKTALYREHSTSMSKGKNTHPKIIESTLEIKYRYYVRCNENIKKIIRRNIYFYSAYLYRSNYPSAGKWLKVNYRLNPGFVSFTYYIANAFGIPCSFLDTIKLKLGFRQATKN